MHTIVNDIRHAVRDLLKARGFAFVAIVTLALGIGAPTAMFTVINALLLRPLPFRAPDQLVSVGEYRTTQGDRRPIGSLSYPNFADVRDRNHSFESIAAYRDSDYTATGFGEPRHVDAENVSAALFRLLGTQPALGRGFLANEDQPGHHVAILSDAFWRAHFNADAGVMGRAIELGGRSFTIVGVMPRGFQFPVRADARDMWLTFARDAEGDEPGDTPLTSQRGAHMIEVIARLKAGVTMEQANADLGSIAHALSVSFPNTNAHSGMGARSELENLVGDTRTSLLTLFGAVGLVLLIACVNVANLLLNRGASRSREIAIRSALGATRPRMIRQLITESLVLSLVSGVLGIAVASVLLSAVLRFYPANLPRAQEIDIDLPVVLFTIGLAIVTGILFGVLPALRVSAPNLIGTIREGGRSMTSGVRHNRLRSGLVIAEMALGVMLLIGAGLLIRSLERLAHAPLGFTPQHLLTASFDLSETLYNGDQTDRFVTDLVSRLGTLPGVTSASAAMPLPLHQDMWTVSFNLLDHPLPEANQAAAGFYNVVPGFFETMQIPLLRGRTFSAHDTRNSTPVMIVTQAFVRKYFPNEDPIGRRVKIGASEGPSRDAYKTRQIIGVVGDIRNSRVAQPPAPAYYVPFPQLAWGAPTLVIRTAADPTTVSSSVRQVLTSMDRDAPLYAVRSMEDYLAMDLGRARFQTILLGFFAGIALLLTAIGLYGVIAYIVTQRTHEIGVRIALGASRGEVLRIVMQRGMGLTLAGVSVGIAGALGLSRVLQSLLYETEPRDPLTYVAVCFVLTAVALLASYIPALRAARVNPIEALRYE